MLLYLVALSAALSAGLLVFTILAVVPGRDRALRSRMVEIGLYGQDEGRATRMRLNRFQEMVRLAGDRTLRRGTDWSFIRRRLIHAGYRDPVALPLFLGFRITAAVVLFVAGVILGSLMSYSIPIGLGMGIWAGFTGWYVPTFLLSRRITRRQKQITKALPDALDLLVICVEAGLGLNQALLRVAREMRHVDDLITEEISQTNLEIRAGTPRDQALLTMADRTGVADVRSLATMLIQTERFGTSIAKSLRVHAETLRTKRRQRAEEAAARTTIKLVFPLALCIFPALFVVVLAPALIQIFFTLAGIN